MNEYLPTKTNLMKLQSSIKLSKQGQLLLERKKLVLESEREKYKQKALKLRKEINNLFKDGYKLLQEACMTMGMDKIENIAKTIELKDELDIKYKTLMGVEIPSIVFLNKFDINNLNYDFYTTTIIFDKVVLKFNEIKSNLIVLTELENIMERLENAIRKVQTRSNALKNIIIPEQEYLSKKIQDILEEKERENFSRLKIIKNQM